MTTHIVPIIAITAYVNYPKNIRINPTLLYFISIVHNLFLVLFSAWSFFSLSSFLYNDKIVFQSNYYFQNPDFDRIIFYFYISKYYEFVDTFLLYLNNKTPIFLQKYHHIGAVLCWHLTYLYKVDGVFIATLLNSFVHMIMYSYYLGCLLKIDKIRIIKSYITRLQLCQLIPQPLCLVLYKNETTFNYTILYFFTAYSCILVLLFSHFYYKNYIQQRCINE